MNRILICGYGNIGQHLYEELKPLENKDYQIDIYDKYKNIGCNLNLDDNYNYAFICVPTESLPDGSADTSEVEDIISKILNTEIIIIKSAIPVGTCEKINKQNVIISPEYWGTTQHCPEQNFLVIGSSNMFFADKLVQLYSCIKNGYYRYYFTNWRTAELVKYMENCWIATKVTFCNEFANIAKNFNVSYPELRELWLADSRVSPSHTLVYESKPYYDSHCLNKDIPALIKFCQEKGVETPLMSSVLENNIKLKNS